jgi:hypothetical protein
MSLRVRGFEALAKLPLPLDFFDDEQPAVPAPPALADPGENTSPRDPLHLHLLFLAHLGPRQVVPDRSHACRVDQCE